MPKIVDHAAQRERILAVSFDLFADKGYASVSMRELAKLNGVSTGTLYHYFPSKDAIFEAMLRWLAERDARRLVEEIPPEATQAERLPILFAWLKENADYLSRLLVLATDFIRHRPDDGPELIRPITSYYRGTMRDQLLIGEEPGALLYSFVLGMLAHRTLDPQAVDIDSHLALIAGLLSQLA